MEAGTELPCYPELSTSLPYGNWPHPQPSICNPLHTSWKSAGETSSCSWGSSLPLPTNPHPPQKDSPRRRCNETHAQSPLKQPGGLPVAPKAERITGSQPKRASSWNMILRVRPAIAASAATTSTASGNTFFELFLLLGIPFRMNFIWHNFSPPRAVHEIVCRLKTHGRATLLLNMSLDLCGTDNLPRCRTSLKFQTPAPAS